MLVSLGPDGALLAADDGKVRTCAVPEGKLVDSTGAGDSMAAGFIAKAGLSAAKDQCLKFAVACGCASAYSFELLTAENLAEVFSRTPEPVCLF